MRNFLLFLLLWLCCIPQMSAKRLVDNLPMRSTVISGYDNPDTVRAAMKPLAVDVMKMPMLMGTSMRPASSGLISSTIWK